MECSNRLALAYPLFAGLQLLGKVDEKFVEVVDVFEPVEDGRRDK
jgi:hypothetical protein